MKFRLAVALVLMTLLGAPPRPAFAVQPGAAAADAFPLDSLTAAEIEHANTLLRADSRTPKDGLVVSMDLREPAKRDVYGFKAGSAMAR